MLQPSDEIKQKLDIVDVIREYLPLKAAGMNFRAKCPFHREKTPSFMVSPDKQIWHCFGCSKGGDIFSFIQEMEGVDFVEALRILAPKAGVTLKRQDPKLASQRNRILDILELARRYYHKNLLDSKAAQSTRDYLASRDLKEETIEEWQIGYSPDSWENVSKLLKQKGFTENELFLAGLSVKSDTSSRFYDRFRGRIMFPLNDVNSNTVAFSARVSPDKEDTEKMGKYINSPATQVYDKSKVLFGLDKAKLEIKKQDLAIIVEGQMDVITAHQAGYKHVVASSGTALTRDQVQILKRYTNNLALSFDMDEAGNLAADRGIREALRAEMNITVIELPPGLDPDECIREEKDTWEIALKAAKPMMQFYFDTMLPELDLTQVRDRREAAKKILPIIGQVENKIEFDFWLRKLSGLIDVEVAILTETMKQIKQPKDNYPAEEKPAEAKPSIAQSREEKMSEILLALIFKFPFLLDYALNHLQIDHIVGEPINPLYRNIIFYYNNVNNVPNESEEIDLNYQALREWMLGETEKENKTVINDQLKLLDRLVFLGERDFFELGEEQAKNEIIQIIRHLKRRQLFIRRKEIEKQMADSEAKGNDRHVKELMEEFKILSDDLSELED